MNKIRTIKKIITGKSAVDGAGVKLVRVFGNRDTQDFDPFLLLDAFDSTNTQDYIKGFPWHPHRGIETITYLVRGRIDHGDSLGNRGSIMDGDCQWMTAGSGIIHQEMPQPAERMLGFQLWLNLPSKDKMTRPAYNGIVADKVPVVDEREAKIHVIAGNYKGQEGAAKGEYVELLYLDIELEPRTQWSVNVDSGSTLFVYILEGSASFGEPFSEPVKEKRAILFDGGEVFQVKALEQGTRFVLLSGKPLNEPIAWGGPIVMNTQKELDMAFQELQEDSFIKDTNQ